MAKPRLEDLFANRGPQKVIPPVSRQTERVRVPGEQLTPQERRVLMLGAAERLGIVAETEAMLSLVRAVEGFTNMAAIYAVPNRAMIDAERTRVRGEITEAQARGRAWGKLHHRQQLLDCEMQESGTGYARPSDWFRLFAALKMATKPDGDTPNVFAAESPRDRATFRVWAERYGLDGDGLVRVAKGIRADQEAKGRGSFDEDAYIEKIQALDAKKLHEVLRAGFETSDIFVRSDEGNFVPFSRLPARYGDSQVRERESAIRTETERRVRASPPLGSALQARDFREQIARTVAEEYDARYFEAVAADRGSVGFENGIVSNVFATIRDDGKGGRVGCGYHGIIQPELLAALPKEYIVEERGRPYVRSHDGKTVVFVRRSLIGTHGVGLIPEEEAVEGTQVAALEHAATRAIANAIVYKRQESSRSRAGIREAVLEPFYWNDVHWAYKRLVEDRLPFVAKLAGVDPTPIASFTGEDAENEWMFDRILSSGVTTSKQLDDKRAHFLLTRDDVFVDDGDRAKLQETERQYPETLRLGAYAFPIVYEWDADGRQVTKGVVAIEHSSGFDNNAYRLEGVIPSALPSLGTAEHPLHIVFRFSRVSWPGARPDVQEFPANRFRELLEMLQPQERFLDAAWRRFSSKDPVGTMDIPLTITAKDAFPSEELLRILMNPNPESVRYVVDRDGVEHFAHATLRYSNGDIYRIQYVQHAADAAVNMARAKEKHGQRVAALRSREAMGSEALSERLKTVHTLQGTLDALSTEFNTDNLVAFVLREPPLSEDDQRRVQSYLDENAIANAEMILRNRISDRGDAQAAIDAMRGISATITELEALGFDWRRFDYNAKNRSNDFARPDRDGFYPGDIRIKKSEIYRPSMGRVVGGRMNLWGLQRELPDLQKRLDRELEVLKLKRDVLRQERSETGARSGAAGSGPEVIRRGSFAEDDDGEY